MTSNEIIGEVGRVLRLPRIQDKYGLSYLDIQAFVITIIRYSECVAGRLTAGGFAPDPDDDKIIACAIEGEADVIVTGDKALQGLGHLRDIKVMSSEAFIQALDQETLAMQS